MIELLGFTGLILVTLALMQKDMIRFRYLSLLGGIPFIAQALLLGTISLFITQIVFGIINIVMLKKLLKVRYYEKKIDKLLDMIPPNDKED